MRLHIVLQLPGRKRPTIEYRLPVAPMTPAAPRYLSAASSEQGFVRGNNEDRVYFDDARGLYAVVDGMGGHEAGEKAAEIAVERIRARLERQTGTVEQRIREAIALANNAIFEAAREKPDWKGMACVLTVAVIEDGKVTVGHVGDSRLYRMRRGEIDKVTHDHSPVGEREDSGELSEAEAMQHPRRNEVFRDVGSEERTPDDPDFIEIREIPFEADMAILLCSDGLSDAISSSEILSIVERNAGDRFRAVRDLITAATAVGKDNVSAILIEGEAFAASFGRQQMRTAVRSEPEIGQRTERIAERAPAPLSWYHSHLAWLAAGLIAGAVLVYTFAKPKAPAAPPAQQTFTVTAPAKISDALARAHAGDTVLVTPGTYKEAVKLKEGVDLIARRPHDAIIDGPVSADDIQRTRFEGFQVRGGDIGIRVNNSDVLLMRDDVSGASVAGIAVSGNSRGAVVACTIHNNPGPGILVSDTAFPDIENNLIVANGNGKAPRPGLMVRSTLRPFITGNIFSGNGAEPIWLTHPDQGVIDRNYFLGGARGKKQASPVRLLPPEVSRESR